MIIHPKIILFANYSAIKIIFKTNEDMKSEIFLFLLLQKVHKEIAKVIPMNQAV